MKDFVYGHWAVKECLLANRRQISQLLLSERVEEKGIVAEIIRATRERGYPIKRVSKRILDDLTNGANHQNTVLRVGNFPYKELHDVLALAKSRDEKPFILLLDLLKDPQNVGSLMRVADAVGVHGVIMQDRRGVSVTPSVVNASSGAVEHVNVVQVTNLVNTIKELKDNDVWIVGLDIGPEAQPISQLDLNMSLGVVLGSEGEGMRRLVRENCDLLLTLPMRGHVASLNASTAGSIVLYNAWQARNWQGWQPASKR